MNHHKHQCLKITVMCYFSWFCWEAGDPSAGLCWAHSCSYRPPTPWLGLRGPRCSQSVVCQLVLAVGQSSSLLHICSVTGVPKTTLRLADSLERLTGLRKAWRNSAPSSECYLIVTLIITIITDLSSETLSAIRDSTARYEDDISMFCILNIKSQFGSPSEQRVSSQLYNFLEH